jgi:hypothetical protein
LEAPRQQT